MSGGRRWRSFGDHRRWIEVVAWLEHAAVHSTTTARPQCSVASPRSRAGKGAEVGFQSWASVGQASLGTGVTVSASRPSSCRARGFLAGQLTVPGRLFRTAVHLRVFVGRGISSLGEELFYSRHTTAARTPSIILLLIAVPLLHRHPTHRRLIRLCTHTHAHKTNSKGRRRLP